MNEKTSPVKQHAPHIQEPRASPRPSNGLIGYFREYAREKPGVVALWSLGIGLVLGWKLKRW